MPPISVRPDLFLLCFVCFDVVSANLKGSGPASFKIILLPPPPLPVSSVGMLGSWRSATTSICFYTDSVEGTQVIRQALYPLSHVTGIEFVFIYLLFIGGMGTRMGEGWQSGTGTEEAKK